MEEALVARLRAVTAITSLVGTSNSRAAIDWIERPEVLPAITLQKVAAGRRYAHDGATGLENPAVQIDCWAGTYGDAKILSRAVIAEMETTDTTGSVVFDEAFLDVERDMKPEDLGGGIKVFRVSLDFSVWHSPAA